MMVAEGRRKRNEIREVVPTRSTPEGSADSAHLEHRMSLEVT